jgi:SAM-dependent methyltransferase
MTQDTTERLFDLGEEYETLLQKGIGLSGEDARHFVVGRVNDLKKQLPPAWLPQRILDFGCGIGTASRYLAEVFSGSSVIGVDLSGRTLDYAARLNGSERVRFAPLRDLAELGPFDLCYVNGVFHHIRPEDRSLALAGIRSALRPGGHFALFENNPWNPGTRMVMKRIPFDRDAVPLAPPEVRRILRAAGFRPCGPMRFLFYFPRVLRALRFTEPWLVHVPLGAQYYQLSQRM